MDNRDQFARIRKLLAMAEDEGLSDAARDAYNAKAADLIAKYGIDQALLEAQRPAEQKVGDVELAMEPPYALDKLTLLTNIAGPLGCTVIRATTWRDGVKRHHAHLFGMESDLRRAELLFTSLLVQAAHGLGVARVPYGEDARAFRRSWLAGFGQAIRARLQQAEASARDQAEQTLGETPGGRSAALVLADRQVLVATHVAEVYPHLRSGSPRRLSGSGSREGYQAGQRVDLGGSRLGGQHRRALG
jgi:hypothetical protein